MKTTTKQVPVSALMLAANIVEAEPQDDSGRWRVRLVARTGCAIEHHYFGRLVHDMAGMTHDARIPIDYRHDDGEVIGYADTFEIDQDGSLVLGGELVSTRQDDRAADTAAKMRAGIPYQASIFFTHATLEQCTKGTADANGATFDAPATIVRQWRLRGVAICPYGYDAGTHATTLGEGQQTAAVLVAETGGEMEREEIAGMIDEAVRAVDARMSEAIAAVRGDLDALADMVKGDGPAKSEPETPEAETGTQALRDEIAALSERVQLLASRATPAAPDLENGTGEGLGGATLTAAQDAACVRYAEATGADLAEVRRNMLVSSKLVG